MMPVGNLRGALNSDDDRAVSPVVGVAILVGITVILASVVGAFVFGLVDIGESSPSASFTFESGTEAYGAGPNETTLDRRMIGVRALHNSGESIAKDELVVKASGNQSEPQSNDSVYWIDYSGRNSDDDVELVWNSTPGESAEFVRPGDSRRVSVYGIGDAVIGGDQIWDYNVSKGDPPSTGKNPPVPLVSFGGEDNQNPPYGYKLGNCDIIEIVWTSSAGDRGQVIQTYRLPGAQCT